MVIMITIFVAIAATFATYYISMHLDRGPVFASAVITLFAGILFSYVVPEWGIGLGAVAACGSYAAMVTKERFPKIIDMVFLGILTGAVFVLTENVFIGIGGRLGSIAAISGFTLLGFKDIRKRIMG